MVFKFKSAFDTTQGAFRADPKAADASFSAASRLGDGVNSRVSVRQFHVPVDEPASLGGTDTAPNPVEYILVRSAPARRLPIVCMPTPLEFHSTASR
jgi:putative redox protein